MQFDKSKVKFVSGPVNIIRLEGIVDNISKVIYLFADYHIESHLQTKCENSKNIHIKYVFANEFRKMSKNKHDRLDFFCESNNVMINSLRNAESGMYISNVYKYIYKQNKLKIFHNVFIHQIDMRIYMGIYNIHDKLNELNVLLKLLIHKKTLHIETIKAINTTLNNIRIYVLYYIDAINELNDKKYKIKLNKVYDISSIQTDNDIYNISHYKMKEYIKYYIYKLMYVIDNKHLQKHIIHIINTVVLIYFKDILVDVNNIENKLSKCKDANESIYKLLLISEDIFYKVQSSLNTLVDLYIIKRFLDKKYINRVMAYTGGLHSISVCQILLKYFNFKITHIANMPTDLNLKNINKIIKNSSFADTNNILHKVINTNHNLDIIQCSDISNLPANLY